ncbi:hypothetical protein CYMTET_12157 [Cymbomonas tetramitiformis]|uniref:Terpene utilization protein AtuA n=1 Tax=Cymbomonas tetramitiformis TaxID=36881 RepID=A0AAE0GKU7_9CHLO|nr:hypothetical protein CYMTET_12157 [Cymbomonas tetramitiformis]
MTRADGKVRVGCYSGFWGDSLMGPVQLVRQSEPPLDYLVADYLAEVTMGILARQRGSQKPSGGVGKGGYIAEFVTEVWKPLCNDILDRGVRVVTNAGGLDPLECKRAIEEEARKQGREVVVAAVSGDDLFQSWGDLLKSNAIQEFKLEGEEDSLPPAKEKVLSVNAYFGAGGIVEALRQGAQVVVTGRCADSALVLGPLIHEFGWGWQEWDKLASGSLIGHLLECGCQCTGGNYTDWRLSANSGHGGWSNMGFPIAECAEDGSCVITKPPRTGGLVTPGTVAEQLVYEMGDPAAYLLPDVIVDSTQVRLAQVGEDRVRVEGVKGMPPTGTYKCSITTLAGYKMISEFIIGGLEARLKSEAMAESILQRASAMIKAKGLPPFSTTLVEVLGCEHTYGPHARAPVQANREVVVRVCAEHSNPKALSVLAKELAAAATGGPPGAIGFCGGGRPRPAPKVRHTAVLVNRALTPATVTTTGKEPIVWRPEEISSWPTAQAVPASGPLPAYPPAGDRQRVPLVAVAIARSGDKGDSANVGVMARKPEYYPLLKAALTPEVVQEYFRHLVKGQVTRYELPGIHGINFILTQCLGGGGLASLQVDKQGKSFAQMLLSMEIEVPAEWNVSITPVGANKIMSRL